MSVGTHQVCSKVSFKIKSTKLQLFSINLGHYSYLVSFTVSYHCDIMAGDKQVIVPWLTKWKWQSSNMIIIKQQSWPISQVHGNVPNVFNMGIQGQMWLHRQIMELAAVAHACCLPSEDRMMLMSGTNHSHDLDLDWQSMSVHWGPRRDRHRERDTETDMMHHGRAYTHITV